MSAKPFIVGGVLLFSIGGYALAAVPCAPGARMSSTQISTLVVGNYTCVGTFPNATWNELLSGGTITDYKLGPSSVTDPSQVLGTYTIGGQDNNDPGGTVTYSYSGGGSFAWFIDVNHTGNVYTFCPTGGGSNLAVNVQPAHC